MLHHANNTHTATRMKFFLFVFLSFIVWQSSLQPAKAATTWTICQSGGCDFTSIQAAINGSGSEDTLVFTPANSVNETYSETININKSLTFLGQKTTINANGSGTAVTISGSPTVVMDNMIIRNGSVIGNGGGIQMNSDGNLTLNNVTLINNSATGSGGALHIGNSGSSVTLSDLTIQANTAVSGGGIYNSGTLNTDNVTLASNFATNGGGLYNKGQASLENQSSVRQNGTTDTQTTLAGGGIYNDSGASLTLITTDVANNDANDGAGIFNAGTLQVTNANLGGSNIASNAGGGLHNSGQATLTNSTVIQNDGLTGAGIYNEGTLIADNSTLSRNDGDNGAGLYNMNGSTTLNNVTIHLTIGTSIFINGGTVTVGNSIISSTLGNPACGGGGLNNAVSNGYNLANDQSCTFLSDSSSDIQGIDPDLAGIIFPTGSAAYHTPKLTSPVIDTGNPATPGSGGTACLASDLRGLSRPQSRQCDIGAVEIVVFRVYVPLVIK